jgi:fatty-acid peroxygenase
MPFVSTAALAPVPRVPGWEHTAALLADPYRFIGRACRAARSDVVMARVMLQPTLCLTGPHAAELFYDGERFRRAGAAPEPVRATLFGKGGVQTLDGPAHRERKRFFLACCSPAETARLVAVASLVWGQLAPRWQKTPRLPLYAASQDWLARTVCRWAGVPLREHEPAVRTQQLVALFDGAAGGLGPHLRARRARHAAETWLGALIERQRRDGSAFTPQSPASEAAGLRDGDGGLVPPRIAAIELLNLLRPTVAVSVYAVQAAHALHHHPGWRDTLGDGNEADLDAFVQEVRRFYPFFPAVAAVTTREFGWNGLRFPAGMRTLLDLHGTNHDARAWVEPDAFRPERFLGIVPGLFDLVPQGGGRADVHHRCPGEGFTLALMKLAVHRLAVRSRYEVPAQDLRIRMERLPAVPADGFVIADFRAA